MNLKQLGIESVKVSTIAGVYSATVYMINGTTKQFDTKESFNAWVEETSK